MFPWYSSAMLVMESTSVIGLRLTKLTRGGSEAGDEASRRENRRNIRSCRNPLDGRKFVHRH